MYIIVESTPKESSIVIDVIIDEDIEKEICKYVKGKYNNFTLIDKSNSTNIMNNEYPPGKYLVKSNNNFCLYKKYSDTNTFNTTNQTLCIKKICEWNVLSCKNKVINKLRIKSDPATFDKFTIFNFQLSQMKNNPKILILAKRGSGKSYIIKDILKYLEKLHPNKTNNLIIAPSEIYSPVYSHKRSNLSVNTVYTLKEAQTFINGCHSNTNYIVYDDAFPRNKNIHKYARSPDFSSIVAVQPPLGISTELSRSFDYVFLLKENCKENKEDLWKNYAHMFPTFASFEKVFDEVTDNYKCMVVAQTNLTNNIQDKVFWFKASK